MKTVLILEVVCNVAEMGILLVMRCLYKLWICFVLMSKVSDLVVITKFRDLSVEIQAQWKVDLRALFKPGEAGAR